jgi:replication-associated recombination protein RarA
MARELMSRADISHMQHASDPRDLEELVYPSISAKAYLTRWVARSTTSQNLLLYGPPGSGKTRASYLLARTRCAEFMDEDPIRYYECESGTFDELLQIRKSESTVFGKLANPLFESIAILDEVDNFKPQQQKQLKKVMERTDQCYILTTNHIDAVDIGVRNRCYEIPWSIPSFDCCKTRLTSIASALSVQTLDDETLRGRVYTTEGWSQMLLNLEALS